MVTKRSLHHVSSLQTSANAIENNVVRVSLHLILFWYMLTANSMWITASKSGYRENGLLVNMENIFLQNSVALHVCYLIAVGLTLWTYDFWCFPTVHRVYISSSTWREHSICISQYAVENKWRNYITQKPIWRNYITPSILVMQFCHRWRKFVMMLILIQWRLWEHYLSVCCVL